MPIYTRTGDKGETSLFGGKRISKASLRVETYGTIDELNSVIGVVIAHLTPREKELKRELETIQNDLLDIGSALARPGTKALPVLEKRINQFESLIDTQMGSLPPLRNFILPGGGKPGSLLHHARTVCRRAERALVRLAHEEEVSAEHITYINRLSDLLFSSARFVNFQEKKKETIWKK